jgi:hypothetical protein
MYLTSDSGYGSDQGAFIAIPLVMTLLVGISGYLHKDGE